MKKDRREKFSIRKFSFGAASCLIGAQIAISGVTNTVKADGITAYEANGDKVTAYAHRESVYKLRGTSTSIYNAFLMEVDTSKYTKENPIITVTLTYNAKDNQTGSAPIFWSGRPFHWFTVPEGTEELGDNYGLTLTNGSGVTNKYLNWSSWESNSRFIHSRYNGSADAWERHNTTTGETLRKTPFASLNSEFNKFLGDYNNSWYDNSNMPTQKIMNALRTQSRSIYVDWEKRAAGTVTVTYTTKVKDPVNTKELTIGMGVYQELNRQQYARVETVKLPVLYKLNELFEPKVPGRTGVVDKTKLTDDEVTAIKEKIWTANNNNKNDLLSTNKLFKDNLKDSSNNGANSISIDKATGNATITYKDNSTDTIKGSELIYEKPKASKDDTSSAELKIDNSQGIKYYIKPVAVKNYNSITQEDRKKALDSFSHENFNDTGYEFYKRGIQYFLKGYFKKEVNLNVGTNSVQFKFDNNDNLIVERAYKNTALATIPKEDLFLKPAFDVVTARNEAKKVIGSLDNLYPSEKTGFETRIDGATDREGIERVLNEAQSKANENAVELAKMKKAANDKINVLGYLTPAEKDAAINKINSATIKQNDAAVDKAVGTNNLDTDANREETKARLNKIVAELEKKNLEKAKEEAINNIKNISDENLPKAEKDKYIEDIKKAGNEETILNLVKEAQKKASDAEGARRKAEADKVRQQYKDMIANIPGLTDQEKTDYNDAIDKATSTDEMAAIVDFAKLSGERKKAVAELEKLQYLNNNQKQSFKDRVENSANKEDIENYVSQARQLNSKMKQLHDLAEKAKTIKPTVKYTSAATEKQTAFDNALEKAESVLNKENGADETISTVGNLFTALETAINNLQPNGEKVKINADKSALQAEYDKKDSVKNSPAYTKEKDEAKKRAYDNALIEAKKILDNTDATQDAVDKALEDLESARSSLTGKADEFELTKKDDKPVPISVDPVVGATNLSSEDKKLVQDKINGIPTGAIVIYKPIVKEADKKYVPVNVTHENISKEIEIEVVQSEATKSPLTEPKKVKVNNVGKLSEAEKTAVKEAVKKANNTLKDNQIEVDDKGNVKVTYSDGTDNKLTADKTVEAKTEAEKSPLKDPEKVKVNNVGKLSEAEKTAVKAAVKKANDTLQDNQIEVDGKGKVTVTYSDNSHNELTADKTVEAKTEAEKSSLKDPEKVKVNNVGKLSEDEKASVKAAVKKANDTLQDNQIEVDEKGKVTVTYSDNSHNELTADKTVEAKTEAEKSSLTAPEKVKVNDVNNLSDDEKAAVKAAVKKVNPTLKDNQISVDNTGKVTVTYSDNSHNELTADKTVEAKTEAEKSPLTAPKKVKVNDVNNLSEEEKTAVENAVKEANPSLKTNPNIKVTVDEKGKVTVTYPDTSTNTLEAGKTVEAKKDNEKSPLTEPKKVKVNDVNNLSEEEKTAVENAVKEANPSLKTNPNIKVTVDEKGKVTVTYPDTSTNTLEAGKTVEAKKDNEKSPLTEPKKVKVNDVNNLSEEEKTAVENAVKEANPSLKTNPNIKVTVDEKGKVTVTYPDTSHNELTPDKTVVEKTKEEKVLDAVKEKAKSDLTAAANKEKEEIDADKNLTEDQKKAEKAKVDKVKEEQEKNIDKATTPEEVAKATEDGKKAIDAVHKTDADKSTPTITSGEVPVSVDPSKDKKVAEADKKAITDAVEVPKDQPQPTDKQVKNDGAIVEGTGANTGKKVVVVEVTYPDGSKDEIEVPVRKEKDADKATPKVKEEITSGEVPVSVDPSKDKKVAEADKKAITDAVEVPKDQPQPTDKQVKNDGAIVEGTGANTGKKVVVVEVTYPDGSKDEIEVPVRKATDKEKAKADLTDAANTEKGEIGGDTTLTDKEKEDLKAKVDEVKKAAEDKINNAKTPEEIAKATEEGKKAIADVYNPQTSKGKSTSIFKPELDLQTALVSGKATVEKGKDLTDEEILKQLALADGVTAKITSKPTTIETGTKEAEVEVTLADGTKVTVKVPVEVVASLDTADKDNDLAKAKEDAKKQVEDAAKKKLDEIKKDKDLTDEQKQKAEEEINKAKEEAKKAIDGASSAGTAKQIADQAKENIEKYDPKADTEVKKPDVTNLDEEKAKAKAEILEEAQKRINEIKNNKDLTDEEKQKAIEAVNKAKDKAIEDINKGQSKDEINTAKEAGIHKINEVQPEGSIASKFEPKVPENKVEVENPSKLSDKEREQIRQNIEGANTFPDGTTVEVKPDGTAVITYKDGSSDTISKDKLVTPANKETGTIASRTEPVIPGKTQVGNTTKLTPEEQAAVKKAVEDANKFPAGTTVEVRPDGTVVITYPDKSVDTITGDKLVEKSTKQTTPKVQTDAEKNPAQVPGNFVPVENTHSLTPAEQDTVAEKVKKANPAATDVKVSKDGTATLTYKDGSVNTIPGTSLVVAKDTDNETATQAAQNPAQVPAPTEVGNSHNLTPAEQSAVAAKVQAANPAAKVTVSKDGTATLTYGDGSVNTIPGTSLVVQKEEVPTQDQPTIAEKTKVIIPANPTKVAEATRLTDAEKEAVKKAVVEANGFGSDVNVEVAGDGTATIIFSDGSAITIPGSQLVAQDPKVHDSNKTDADKTTVKAPAQRVEVKDITHLTDEEKEKVKVAILQANGSALDGVTIAVAGDGTAIITFPDGSVVTILGKDTVQQSAKTEPAIEDKPEYTPDSTPGGDNGNNGDSGADDANAGAGGDTGAANADANSENKENAKGGIQGALAHTGLDNTGGLGLAGLGLAMLSGLLATAKRRKEK